MTADTVLVPLDGSELSDSILPHVERLVRGEGHDVVLLRVLPPPGPDRPEAQAAAERAAAEAHLSRVRARLESHGARVTALVRDGDPAAEVLFAADELRPDLVAMSSHGRTGVLRWLRGSVAERVLRACPRPLLLVTPQARPRGADARLERLLVPLDGGERSAAVLPRVAALARAHQAEVLLLRVTWEPTRPALASVLSPARTAESLRGWAERLREQGVPTRVLTAVGDAANEILDVAAREDVDLIAMATHGRTGLARFVDGSVSETVLRHCRRPLLVVRAPADGAAERVA